MTAKKTEEQAAEFALPAWCRNDLVLPLQAGVSLEFIIHGDTYCLTANPDAEDEPDAPYISLRTFFEKIFDERPLVVFYDIASGLKFPTPEMEKEFKSVAGLEDKSADSGDPVAAARAGLQAKRGLPREPAACLPLIEKVLKKVEGAVAVIQSVHFIAPSGAAGGNLLPDERINIERLRNWGHDDEIRAKGGTVLLLTDQAAKVSPELRQASGGIRTVFIPKPAKAERLAFIRSITEGPSARREAAAKLRKLQAAAKKARSGTKAAASLEGEIAACQAEFEGYPEPFSVPKGFDADSFAHMTQGMSLRQILEIFLEDRKSGQGMSLDYVKSKKRQILNDEYGEVMEVVEPRRGLEDIGGLRHIKKYLTDVLAAIRKGESRLVPMGITLMGPPGTGKTAIVEALAKEAGFNFVKTKNIRSMWLGESEARMERLLDGLRSLSPVVVMNDEADLAEAQRDSPKGDSGVSERLMKRWMELLSDPKIRGQIIVISCTNRPDRIDAALKRSGRSDERLLLPMPGAEERGPIFEVMFKRHSVPTVVKDYGPFVLATDGLSGADIEKIVLNSFRFADRQGRKEVNGDDLRLAIRDFIPSASQADIDLMTLMGILESSSRELLPKGLNGLVEKIRERGLVKDLEAILGLIESRGILAALDPEPAAPLRPVPKAS